MPQKFLNRPLYCYAVSNDNVKVGLSPMSLPSWKRKVREIREVWDEGEIFTIYN
jgi:hypothetical protein